MKKQSEPIKLIFSALGVKRRIEPPFQICGDYQSIEWLRDCLNVALERPDFHMGWIDVPLPLRVHSVDSEPLAWNEKETEKVQ